MDEFLPNIGSELVRTYDPRYDTFTLDRRQDESAPDFSLFTCPEGSVDAYTGRRRTKAETNMTLANMVGVPLAAKFEWMRVFIEDFGHPDDVEWIRQHFHFDVITGAQTIARGLGLNAMSPVLPKGGKDVIRDWIKDGTIRLWPWFQTALPSIGISPIECFSVRAVADAPLALKSFLRVKVSLGPWLYRPDHGVPHYEDRPENEIEE